jgi:hypothetical protein
LTAAPPNYLVCVFPGHAIAGREQHELIRNDAGFVGYVGRHPDIRPDYSHGTTSDMHGLTDYLLLARQKVGTMMQQGLPLEAIEKQFDMHEYKDWDRGAHLSATAATIYRELKGEGPEIAPYKDRTAHVTITKIAEEGRFLTVSTDDGKELHLRAAGDVDFEDIKDRSELKLGMKLKVIYLEPASGNAPLGYDITELELERN